MSTIWILFDKDISNCLKHRIAQIKHLSLTISKYNIGW